MKYMVLDRTVRRWRGRRFVVHTQGVYRHAFHRGMPCRVATFAMLEGK